MRTTKPKEKPQAYRIILLRGEKIPEVLVGFDGTHRTLPTVRVSRRHRVAEHLTDRLRTMCGITAVSLGSIKVPRAEQHSDEITYELMEPCEQCDEAPFGKYWTPANELKEAAFRDPTDFHALRQAVAQSAGDSQNSARVPFGKLGWFSDLEAWVEEQVTPRGLHLNGRFQQLNASPTFSLIRFETDSSAVWFKAAGVPNESECPITLRLASLFPRFVPVVLASRPEWNAWLSLEAEGPLLCDQSCGLAAWKAAGRDLAHLQVCSLGRSLHLLEVGARDLRTYALQARADPFFEVIADLMNRQTKTSPPALTPEDLSWISASIKDALSILDKSNFPSCLGHLDLNPGNIIAPLSGCVFLDWAEAFVGHPFLTFEYLREHFRTTFGLDTGDENDLVSCYSSAWRGFVPERKIHQALEVTPLLAAFAYAVGIGMWADPQRWDEPHAATFLRSLVRRMHREARVLRERNVSCPS